MPISDPVFRRNLKKRFEHREDSGRVRDVYDVLDDVVSLIIINQL